MNNSAMRTVMEGVEAGKRRAAEAARDAARAADGGVAAVTGREARAWLAALQRALHDDPLRAALAALALGYVLGKLTRRR
jgi:hypothetical protein